MHDLHTLDTFKVSKSLFDPKKKLRFCLFENTHTGNTKMNKTIDKIRNSAIKSTIRRKNKTKENRLFHKWSSYTSKSCFWISLTSSECCVRKATESTEYSM